ncbi:pigment epithelium-derived factor-like [Lampetra planeri]
MLPILTLLLLVTSATSSRNKHKEHDFPQQMVEPTTSFAMTRLAMSQANFGFDLYRAVAQESPGENIFMSPLTTSLVLAMLTAGAHGTTEQALSRALYFSHLRNPNVHSTFCDLIQKITSGKSVSKMAARIFAARNIKIKKEFLDVVEQNYHAKPENLHGPEEKDLKRINSWVEEKTDGKIKDFLQELPSNLRMLLLSAIYFKGKWEQQFYKDNTSPVWFHVNEENKTMVDMMYDSIYPVKAGRHPYLPYKVAQLEFQGDKNMLIFLPDEVTTNLTALEQSLSSDLLLNLTESQLKSGNRIVYLPRLRLKMKKDLSTALNHLGLDDLFMAPDFHKISEEPLIVSAVTHVATMDLTEEGAEAAAVTGVFLSRTNPIYPVFKVDRPFLFLIRDTSTGTVLFLGRVMDPTDAAVEEEEEGAEGNHGKRRRGHGKRLHKTPTTGH